LKADILEVLPGVQAKVAYFDPPCPDTTGHERAYRALDEILGDATPPVSPFSRREGACMVGELFERTQNIPVWVLSSVDALSRAAAEIPRAAAG